MKEVWKDIEGYEGYYQVSDLGNFRSSDRFVKSKNNSKRFLNGQLLKEGTYRDGRKYITLSKNGGKKTFQSHRIVFATFNGILVQGLVIDHINNIPTDNRSINLQQITIRENNIKDSKGYTSKYPGVSIYRNIKWRAVIHINGKQKWLGSYDNEKEASIAYEKALNKLNS